MMVIIITEQSLEHGRAHRNTGGIGGSRGVGENGDPSRDEESKGDAAALGREGGEHPLSLHSASVCEREIAAAARCRGVQSK